MSGSVDLGVLLFVTLFALYSPLAALSSYLPIVGRLPLPERTRLAVGLFTYVLIFAMASIWVGEPLLEVLGISTAALSVTGGIALLYASIPMMRGLTDPALAGATEEALRCLRCFDDIMLRPELCILCGLCVDVCPYDCITIERADAAGVGTPGQSALLLDEERCIRCGLCVNRCPPGALVMVETREVVHG
jgi:ferredoxin